jgi:hypothetical protein
VQHEASAGLLHPKQNSLNETEEDELDYGSLEDAEADEEAEILDGLPQN